MSDSGALRLRLGKRVEALAKRSGLSICDVAERSKISHRRVAQILNANSGCVTLGEMSALAAVVDTPLADLLAPCGSVGIVPLEEVEQGRS